MEIILLVIGIGLILYGIYKWGTQSYNYWELRNIKFLKPTFLFGNTFGIMTNQYAMIDYVNFLYSSFPNEKVFGVFDFRQPLLVVRDTDILKQLTVKDFDHFENHRTIMDERADILFGNSLFFMQSEKWRDMRANLSPAFTSSKMRQMYDLVGDTAFEMVEYFRQKTNNGQELNVEMKDLFSKYTNDVIATAAFGLKVNSFENEKNEFFTTGTKMVNFVGVKTIAKILLFRIAPAIWYRLHLQLLDPSASKFFKTVVLDTMKQRTEQNIFRPDMINMLMALKQGESIATATTVAHGAEDEKATDGFATVEESSVGKKKVTRQWNDDELIAQCFLFFFAGFDTSSTALSFIAYELALNADVQQRLYEEVAETDRRLGGKRLPYDELQRMRYMDQVVSEALRMWAPVPIVDRECNKDYEFNDGGRRCVITKGTAVWVLIHAYHHDADNFPNPSKFDPDRFSDENKHKIKPGTYLPFGTGPRNCIGSRFALMEVKAVIYYLMLHFKLVPNAKTQIPLKFASSPTAMKTERGIELQLMPRV